MPTTLAAAPAGLDHLDLPQRSPRSDRPPLAALDIATAGVGRPGRLQLLGGFALCAAPEVPAASARLVALLALAGPLSRSVVVARLWPEASESRAHGALRTSLWRLGRTVPGLVEGEDSLRLRAGVDVDAHRVAGAARALLRADRHRPIDVAALLDSGDLLPGWHDDWVVEERERLAELRVAALEVLSGRARVRRRHGLAVEAAQAAVRLDALRETSYQALIRAHLGQGNRAQALATYQRLAGVLSAELGFGPSEETRSLFSLDNHPRAAAILVRCATGTG